MGLGRSPGPCLHMCLCDSPVVCVSFCVLVSFWFVHHRPHEALAQDRALTALGKVLYLLDRILDGQVRALGRGWGVAMESAAGPRTCLQQVACPGEGWVVQNHVDMSIALCPGPFPKQPPGAGFRNTPPQFSQRNALWQRSEGDDL